jgi:5'-3' exonuclease
MIVHAHNHPLAMGHTVSEGSKNKKSWDSNAITPGEPYAAPMNKFRHRLFTIGTPFMDLLASSLKYWVVQKINTDSFWRTVRSALIEFNRDLIISTCRSKSSFRMRAYLAKASIKSWTTYDGNG